MRLKGVLEEDRGGATLKNVSRLTVAFIILASMWYCTFHRADLKVFPKRTYLLRNFAPLRDFVVTHLAGCGGHLSVLDRGFRMVGSRRAASGIHSSHCSHGPNDATESRGWLHIRSECATTFNVLARN